MGQSPLQHVAQMIDNFWLTQAENRAVATVIGLLNYDQANLHYPCSTYAYFCFECDRLRNYFKHFSTSACSIQLINAV